MKLISTSKSKYNLLDYIKRYFKDTNYYIDENNNLCNKINNVSCHYYVRFIYDRYEFIYDSRRTVKYENTVDKL